MLPAEGYLAQPNIGTFYDIFRAARVIPLVRAADRALAAFRAANVPGLPARLQRRNRYAYRPSDWHGLVHGLEGKFAGPSFLDVINWECALMWRIESDDLLWSIQRLPFTRFFEGIEQLAANGDRTALHVWFERSAEHSHRRAHLLKLSHALAAKSKSFAWLIANETFSDVSVCGRFDFQEHASALGGTLRETEEPLVMNVFVGDGAVRGVGEWGVGLSLPSIDEEPWSDSD